MAITLDYLRTMMTFQKELLDNCVKTVADLTTLETAKGPSQAKLEEIEVDNLELRKEVRRFGRMSSYSPN